MIKTLLIAVVLLTATIIYATPDIKICRTESGFEIMGLNDTFGWDAMTGGATFEGNTLIVLPLENGTIQIVFWWTDENGNDQFGELWGNANTPLCGAGGWQPSAPSILIPAQEGSFKLEIEGDGKWWLVTDQAHPDGIILTAQNGFVELIGSVGQDTDPSHYRLIKVIL